MTNDFTKQLIKTLDGKTDALKALARAMVDDEPARKAVESALFTAGGSGADPIGEIETLILNDDDARRALEAKLFTTDDFLTKVFAEGTDPVKATVLATVAAKATPGVVAQLLADANRAAFVDAIAKGDATAVRKFIDGLRDNPAAGPVVIDEIFADGGARGKVEAKFQNDPPMAELIGVLGADPSRAAFVDALLGPGKVRDAIIQRLTSSPTDLIKGLLMDHRKELLDTLLGPGQADAQADLFGRIVGSASLLGGVTTTLGVRAQKLTADATAAGTPDPGKAGRALVDPVVAGLIQTDEFLDDFAAKAPAVPTAETSAKPGGVFDHVVAGLLAADTAPAVFAAALSRAATPRDKFADVVAAGTAEVKDLKTALKAKLG